jgi:heme/copper-type cytochrome/quinol oxidase subunit 2
MKARIAAFVGLILFAAASLLVAALWSRKMVGENDPKQMDRDAYFLHTWMIAFVIASVAAVFVLINIIKHLRRQHEHADY